MKIIDKNGLKISSALFEFINNEAIPGTNVNLNEFWNNLFIGKSGAAPITYFDTLNFKTKFACELKNYNYLDFFDKKEARRLDKFCQYSLISSDEAIEDSAIKKTKLNLLAFVYF